MNYVIKILVFLTVSCAFLITFVSDVVGSEPDIPASIPSIITPKIIGGTTAVPGAWPWMAALIRSDSTDYYFGQFCGGALIAETWVLTAAHCVYDDSLGTWDDPGEVDVVMGLHNLKTDIGDRISVKRIVGHPDYNPVSFDSDLALLELERSSLAQTLPLMSDVTNDLSGNMAIIIGWGDTDQSDSTEFPDELQQVNVPVIGNTTCSTVYPGLITENMLCAGYAEGGKDSCIGDSGGPLMVRIDNQWQHAGIVSWADGCAIPDAYGVNTRTSRFIDFIASYVTLQPRISVNPPTVHFGYVPLGTPREDTVLVSNQGQEDLVIGNIGHNDPLELPFVIKVDTCSAITLAPAEQCSLVVTYAPEILEVYHASFDIPSNDPVTDSFTVYVTARKQFPWHLFVPAIINRQSQP